MTHKVSALAAKDEKTTTLREKAEAAKAKVKAGKAESAAPSPDAKTIAKGRAVRS